MTSDLESERRIDWLRSRSRFERFPGGLDASSKTALLAELGPVDLRFAVRAWIGPIGGWLAVTNDVVAFVSPGRGTLFLAQIGEVEGSLRKRPWPRSILHPPALCLRAGGGRSVELESVWQRDALRALGAAKGDAPTADASHPLHDGEPVVRKPGAWTACAAVVAAVLLLAGPPPLIVLSVPLVVLYFVATWRHVMTVSAIAGLIALIAVDAANGMIAGATAFEQVVAIGAATTFVTWWRDRRRSRIGSTALSSAWLRCAQDSIPLDNKVRAAALTSDTAVVWAPRAQRTRLIIATCDGNAEALHGALRPRLRSLVDEAPLTIVGRLVSDAADSIDAHSSLTLTILDVTATELTAIVRGQAGIVAISPTTVETLPPPAQHPDGGSEATTVSLESVERLIVLGGGGGGGGRLEHQWLSRFGPFERLSTRDAAERAWCVAGEICAPHEVIVVLDR